MNDDTETASPSFAKIDRETGSTLNPFIGMSTSDTLDNLAEFIGVLVLIFIGCAESPCPLDYQQLDNVLRTVEVALRYEAEASHRARIASAD